MSPSPANEKTAIPATYETAFLLDLYERMVLIRRFELAAQQVCRAGELPGFVHLYIGEEATGVGVCANLRPSDWITSTHRGHGHALAKGVPPDKVMAELYGKATGCCGGRGGTMHLYSVAEGLFGTNGFVGGGLPATVGIGLSARTRGTDQIGLAFFGDGAVNHGSFHESLNLAAVQRIPAVFVCENNLYATATPLTMATLNTEVATKAASYGMPGVAVDGNDVLAVYEVARTAVERARSGKGPTLIEAKTYRTVGHHEGDPLVGTYRTQEELDAWKSRCPIQQFRQRLITAGRAKAADLDRIDEAVETRVQEAVTFARQSPDPDPATANQHVWAEPLHPPLKSAAGEGRVQSWLEAVRDGIAEEMRRDPHIVYLGEGTGERGGTFAHTKGLWQEFGGQRMIDTPISELGFTGACAGSSAAGSRAIADVMFADFLFEAGSQIAEQAAKLRYMSNGQISVPVVVRAAWGTVKSTGPHHSGTYHPIWAHCPGLIVVVPSTPADAKGLFKTALRANDPVLFLEPKALFASKGPVPEGEHFVPFGVARLAREGRDLTVVTCGAPVIRCLEAAETLEAEGIDCEILDLRTIVPLDVDAIVRSVEKTRHVLVVDEAFAMCGIGAEVAAVVMEQAFEALDAPVGRLHTDPTAQPFSPVLEKAVSITPERVIAAARAVLAGKPLVPRRLRPGRSTATATPQREVASALLQKTPTTKAPQAAAAGVALCMPHSDLTITEGTVLRWVKQIGEAVAKGETVVEVETDKAVVAVEAPETGRLVEILAEEQTVVAMGQRLGTVKPTL